MGNAYPAADLTRISTDHISSTKYLRKCDEGTYLRRQDLWGGLRYTEYFRAAWREMIADNGERSLFVALIPPGPAHVHGVRSMAMPTEMETALVVGFWSALPLDYFLRVTGRGHLDVGDAAVMPVPTPEHPLAPALLLRALRLNCLTAAYAELWERLFIAEWDQSDRWATLAAHSPSEIADVGPKWGRETAFRTLRDRRAALVEIDALVAVWLGIGIDELIATYRSRYGVLANYEEDMWFDAAGRRIAANHNAYGHGQTKEHYIQLLGYLEDPERSPIPPGYTAPFYKADRENEYRQAHAVFSKRLQGVVEAGVADFN